MSSAAETTVYCRAAGKSLAAILDYVKRAEAGHKKHKAFAKRFKAKSWQVCTTSIRRTRLLAGLYFDNGTIVPEPWIYSKKRGCYVPNRRTAVGRKLAEEMNALAIEHIGVDGGSVYWGDGTTYSPGFKPFDGGYVILQHEKASRPPDAIPLKRSEYWAIVEAEQSSKPKKKKKA